MTATHAVRAGPHPLLLDWLDTDPARSGGAAASWFSAPRPTPAPGSIVTRVATRAGVPTGGAFDLVVITPGDGAGVPARARGHRSAAGP